MATLSLPAPEFLLEKSEGENVMEVVGCSIARGFVVGGIGERGVMGKAGGGGLVQQKCGPNWVENNLVVGGVLDEHVGRSLELSGGNDGGSGGGLDSQLESTGNSSLTGGLAG